MKRLFLIIFTLLLLTGCGTESPETTAPETTGAPVEPTVPWVEEIGKPWDMEGALVELPLTIPNGHIYGSYMVFDEDLLFWSEDNHLLDNPRLQLCVMDLDTGNVLAQREIPVSVSVIPQVLGDSLYLCDNQSGTILKLDKNLNQIQRWETTFEDAAVYMALNETAYVYKWGEGAFAVDLSTGAQRPVLEEDPDISYMHETGGYLRVEYYHPDNGERAVSMIDLRTGTRQDVPMLGFDGSEFMDGSWLLYDVDVSCLYTLISADGEAVEVDAGYDSLRLMGGNRLMKIGEGNNQISLHDLTGAALAQCTLSQQIYAYESIELIPNTKLGGYFVVLGNHDRSFRLLYWDTTKGERGEDIPFAPVPEPSELEAQIQMRIAQLESEYGVNILVGEEAGGYFFDFEAELVTNLYDIHGALDTLQDALEDYPEGFFRQLRYGDIHRTEIHLTGPITATNSEYVDTYEGFVQENYDSHIMVVNIYLADESTYYHEFSHIIDSFLEWDAMNREGAFFSEDTWCSLNPGWFPGYTYSYSWTQYVEGYNCFVDNYSTINPTEDRARVMEYAMVDYGIYTFENAQVLLDKLDYYCCCIRDAFDTTDWPDCVLWEQYLP